MSETTKGPQEPLPKFRALPKSVDRSLIVMIVMVIVAGVACWFVEGQEAFMESFSADLVMMMKIVPKLAAALLVASFLQLMIPRKLVAKWIGEGSGAKGVAIATTIGAMTPGGPMTSFPMVSALAESGTGRAPLIAYLVSWSNLGFQRLLIWELPLLGPTFLIMRYIACLPLPFLAAWLATKIPMSIEKDKKS
jgi:uncharacterized membrane protein YraQ (UPF0718 family)